MVSALDASSLFGAVHEDIEYELKITDIKDSLLRVASFVATDKLSIPFVYTLVVATDPDSDSIASLEQSLGRDASFAIKRDGKVERIVHGIVTKVRPDGTFIGKTQAAVTVVLEPRLSNLRFSGGFRIFQSMAIHEIVAAIFQPEQIDVSWHVHGTPAKREYTTQFDESDLAFVTRLASEEGMHYYFSHTPEKTTVLFSNEPDGFQEVEEKLKLFFHDDIGAVHGEHIRSIHRGQSVRTGAFEHRDYNFLKPKETLLARAETKGKETTANSHKREVRDYPGRFIDKDGKGKSLAEMRLDELRSDSFTFSGTALSLRLAAGYTFKLEGHRENGFNRKLLLTSVTMEGTIQGAIGNGGFRATVKLVTFTAVPAEVPIHPKRRSKPMSRLQTARVVGPKDGDPYVDEQGRVKVQFYWDRDGKFDEKSSCWIRMMTPVAHADEGFWQAHKVGSEVIVGFIDDDIDRPMILGAVYNTVQSQLYLLPGQVSKSVWRTNSIPGNKGFNEITQNNTAGGEEIYIHAQKDRRTQVLNNHSETVGANQTSSIGANQSISVGANQSVSVGANRSVTVGAAHTVTVTANETNTVHGHRSETVDKGEDVTVSLGRTHTVASGDEALTVGAGNRTVTVSAVDALTADSKVDQIKTTFDLNAGTAITIHHGGDASLTLAANVAILNTNTMIVLTNSKSMVSLDGGNVSIQAADQLTLQCGNASMALSKDGKIAISGATEVGLGCQSSALKLEPAQATLNGSAVNATASGMMQISGALIKIN